VSEHELLVRTFVDVADTLVRDYDVVDVLTTLANRCATLFGGEAGVMLADPDSQLHTVGSSNDRVHQLELFETQHQQGPCPDAYHQRTYITCPDLERDSRWPRFNAQALSAGFRAVHAIPMRLRDDAVGAINLLSNDPGPLAEDDIGIAQALADVATIAVLQYRSAQTSSTVIRQLEGALHSRIAIEQAKGIVAQVLNLDMNDAFATIRRHARRHNRLLVDVANDLISRRLAPHQLDRWPDADASRPRGPSAP